MKNVMLGAAAVLLGGLSFFGVRQASALSDDPALRNSAVTDNAATSEVKGEVASAVNAAFSYNFADLGKTDQAVARLLTGPAVQQHSALFGKTRAEAPEQKYVLTTTVTDSAVKTLQGDRARLLVFADQLLTRGDGKSGYEEVSFAVDAIRQEGHWRISGIDLF